MRVSLSDDPVKEIKVAKEILKDCNLYHKVPTLVACPTCGRTQIDLIPIAKEVEAFLDDIGRRASFKQMNLFLLSVCRWKDMKLQEMANLLDRESKHILRKYIQPLMDEEKLTYIIPDMPNHPG